MDAWNEYFDYAKWTAAFTATGIDPAFYAHREIPLAETLPWSHIRCKRTEDWLQKEYQDMMDILAAE
jgi:hypothetical protein